MPASKTALVQDRLARWLAAMPARRKALWVGLAMVIGPITATAAILLLSGVDRLLARV
jgi:hypothetical protein